MRYAALIFAGAAMLLGACAGDNRVAVNGGGVGVGVDVGYYDGYYDGFYGPFNDGYWGTDGAFYYSNGDGSAWNREDGHHFRRDMSGGFNHIHGRGGPATAGMTNHP